MISGANLGNEQFTIVIYDSRVILTTDLYWIQLLSLNYDNIPFTRMCSEMPNDVLLL